MLAADLDGVRRFVAREEHEPGAREAFPHAALGVPSSVCPGVSEAVGPFSTCFKRA